jgi:hypothetical protein
VVAPLVKILQSPSPPLRIPPPVIPRGRHGAGALGAGAEGKGGLADPDGGDEGLSLPEHGVVIVAHVGHGLLGRVARLQRLERTACWGRRGGRHRGSDAASGRGRQCDLGM